MAVRSEAAVEVGVNAGEVEAVIQGQQHFDDDQIAEKVAKNQLHITECLLVYRARDADEGNPRKAGANHAEGHQVPRRRFASQEKSGIVAFPTGQSGNQNEQAKVGGYESKYKRWLHIKIEWCLFNLGKDEGSIFDPMNFPSRLIEEAVLAFSRFPGIGKKTALRLTLHLLRQDPAEAQALATAVHRLTTEIQYCQKCHNISDAPLCLICANDRRDHGLVCVVADMRDVIAIENTGQFGGVYHVLGGLITPMEGIGPHQLKLASLEHRAASGEVREMVLAFSATMEGDTTAFYIGRKFKESGIKMSTIARGIAIGGELEYADEITLGRSIQQRIPFGL